MNKAKREGGTSIATIESGYKRFLNGHPVIFSTLFPKIDGNPSIDQNSVLFGSMKTMTAMADRMGKEIRITKEGKTLVTTNKTLILSELRFGFEAHDPGTATEFGAMSLLYV